MSIRINRATTFNGKSYVITSELQKLSSDVTFAEDILTFAGQTINGQTISGKTINLSALRTQAVNDVTGNALVEDKIILGNTSASVKASDYGIGTTVRSDFGGANKLATESGVKDYVDNKAITVSAGTGITIDNTNILSPIIGTNIKLQAKSSANGDSAASYELVYFDPSDSTYKVLNGSADINIPKDQFLKSADFGWATAGDGTGWSATHTAGTNDVPVIKFVVYTTTNGVTADKELFIDCTSFYHDYTAGDGIDGATIATDNVIKVKKDASSEQVYATAGTTADVLTISSDGVKVANIQSAIDTAVNDEHAKAAVAVSALNDKIETSVTNINTAIETTVSSINDTIDAVEGAVDASVSATVESINTNVGAVTSKVVELVETTVTIANAGNVTITDGVVSVSGITGNVLAVFGADGQQIYPEITKTGAKTGATNVLTADYGTETPDSAWTVLHTQAITYTAATAGTVTPADSITASTASQEADVELGNLTYKNAN